MQQKMINQDGASLKVSLIASTVSDAITRSNADDAGGERRLVQPLDPGSFPHQPRAGTTSIPCTIPNVERLLSGYGIVAQYDIIKKKLMIRIPGLSGTSDNADNVAAAYVISAANLNGMYGGQVMEFVSAIADKQPYNAAAMWIHSRPWDGKDRLGEFCDVLVHREGFPDALKRTLIYRWLISAVAAALSVSGFRARGVLTLQGGQSIGKTEFFKRLVSDPVLRDLLIKLDHHLDAGNKDSVITALCHWIVEIGELDSSFKKDVARLKGFLTRGSDKIRRPYGRTDCEYPRRTVFCATVNDTEFLVDATGNSRWWTIPVVKVDYEHGIDMQQLFAQMAIDFRNGERWWLTSDEESLLEAQNQHHRISNAIRDLVVAEVDMSRVHEPKLPAMTPSELLRELGVRTPSNLQCKDCGAVLRELLGDSRRIRGANKWRVPLKRSPLAGLQSIDKEIY